MIDFDVFIDGKTYMVSDEDDIHTQVVSYSDAWELWEKCKKENENLEKDVNQLREELATLRHVVELYEAASIEAEAILGGEYAMHYGPLFDMLSEARVLLKGVSDE